MPRGVPAALSQSCLLMQDGISSPQLASAQRRRSCSWSPSWATRGRPCAWQPWVCSVLWHAVTVSTAGSGLGGLSSALWAVPPRMPHWISCRARDGREAAPGGGGCQACVQGPQHPGELLWEGTVPSGSGSGWESNLFPQGRGRAWQGWTRRARTQAAISPLLRVYRREG